MTLLRCHGYGVTYDLPEFNIFPNTSYNEVKLPGLGERGGQRIEVAKNVVAGDWNRLNFLV